jgi:hypothetical protein
MLKKFIKTGNVSILNYLKLRIFEYLCNNLNNQKKLNIEIKKSNELINKIKYWKKFNGKIYLSKHYYYKNIDQYCEIKNSLYFFNFDLDTNVIKKDIDGSVVIINSNDIFKKNGIKQYENLVRSCTETVFVLYLYDNHHIVTTSVLFASLSDIIISAHPHHRYLLSNYCSYVISPLCAPIYSWSMPEILNYQKNIFNMNRGFDLGGNFNKYEQFPLRNEIISSLHKKSFKWDIKLNNLNDPDNYQYKTPAERILEWTSYKTSLIVSTQDDIPIRFFDSMLTGSIPIVHAILKNQIESLEGIKHIKNHICWFTEFDLIGFEDVVERATKLFDSHGLSGIKERTTWAMKFHMRESVIHEIVDKLDSIIY